jgi:hypothetical protein
MAAGARDPWALALIADETIGNTEETIFLGPRKPSETIASQDAFIQ